MCIRDRITGRSVHTVAKSADVLDDKTVQKIDELANYIKEYYYDDYDKDDLENGLLHGVMEGLNAVSYTHLSVRSHAVVSLITVRVSCVVVLSSNTLPSWSRT